MFYVWLLTSVLFLFSIVAQLFSFTFGIMPNASNLFLTIALQITALSLTLKKYNEPHKVNYTMLAVGVWSAVFGMFLLLLYNHTSVSAYFIIEAALFFISIGAVIYFYNKKGLSQEEYQKIIFKNELVDETDIIYDLLFEIEETLSIETDTSSKFYNDLLDLETQLNTILCNHIAVNHLIIQKTMELLSYYYSLKIRKVQSKQSIQIQEKIQEAIANITLALSNLNKEEEKKNLEIVNTEIEIINTYLNSMNNSHFI